MLSIITAEQANALVSNFNWHTPSWDLFVFLFWIVASIVYSFATGRGRVINILLSVYMAKLLVLEAPFLTTALNSRLNLSIVSLQQLAAFIVIFLALFMLLGRFVFKTSADGRHLGSMLFNLVFSFLQIGLLINIVLTFLPPSVQQSFAPLIQFLFINGAASFIWLVIPIAFLIVLGKFVGDTSEM